MGHMTSLSDETPKSIANAYDLEMEELLALNEGTLPPGTDLDAPLWLGTPIILPATAVQARSPACRTTTPHSFGKNTLKSHRQNATGMTAQTSLLREASKLSTNHLLRMHGHPTEVLASYAEDPILSPEHKKQALHDYDAGQDEHGRHYHRTHHQSDPFSRIEGKTTSAAPKRKWFLPYGAKVDLDTVGRPKRIQSGLTSKGIREDGRRDRRAAEHLAHKHDHATAELQRASNQARKVRNALKRQYNRGPGHALLHPRNKTTAGHSLRQQIREGNLTQFKRLAKFAHSSGSTSSERIVENVHFVGRLLMVNPSTGSPTKKNPESIPAVQPGSRLTLRIEAHCVGHANELRPVQQKANDIGCVLAVQRGTLVKFEVKTGKTSGLRVVKSVSGGGVGSRRNMYGSGVSPGSKSKKIEPSRMLWKGNHCVIDIPLLCGKGAVSGLSLVKLNILVGQHFGILKFQTDVMSSFVSRKNNEVLYSILLNK